MEKLQALSAKEHTSLTTYASAALRKYAEWGAVYLDYGLAVMSKGLIRKLFDRLPEYEARELGRRSGREETPHLVMAMYKTFNLDNVLKVFGRILGMYSGAFIFEHSRDGRVHTVIIRHGLGKSASAFYAEYFKSVCELLDMPASATETADQVIVSVTEIVTELIPAGKYLPTLLVEESAE